MEIAVVNPQAVLQMYQCKDYPWHALGPSLSVAAPADNKEKIIANADFTTTSAIARRRLSSKKRKNAADSGDSSTEGSTSSSPTGHLDSLTRHPPQSSSPPTTSFSAHPSLHSVSAPRRSLADLPTTHISTHLPPHTHQVVPSHPQATVSVSHNSTVPLVPAAYHHFAPSLPVATAADHKAFTHPVYSQLQQELNYRYLQDQSGSASVCPGNRGTAAFSAPHQVGVATAAMDQSESCRPHQVRWSSAHVTIARQILAHQQQAKTLLEMAHNSSLANDAQKTLTTSTAPPTTSLDPAQQIALLQMYGIPTTTGYMAMPGMSYPDVQLHNLSFVPNTAPTALFMDASNVLSLKPMAGVATQASETSNRNVHVMNGMQILPYPASHPQPLPMAAVMPGLGLNGAVSGSYIGHVPVPVIGNCVLNPCQPGVMAAPWVR